MKKSVLFVLALIVVAGVVLFLNLGGAVKRTIEVVGSRTLGTAVRVSGVSISLSDKSASMSGLSIKNPSDFKENYLLKTKDISVKISDVTREVVTIDEIVVDGMTVTYELGASGTNLDAIKRNVKSAPASSAAAESKGGQSPRVIIRKLRIINAQVVPSIGVASQPVILPEIAINNIGSNASPADPAKVATQIINKILAVSSEGALRAGLASAVDNALKGVPVGDVMKKTDGLLKGLIPKMP